MEQIFPFDMEYIPSFLWILTAFADTTIEIFEELSESIKNEIFKFVEKGVTNSDDYISTEFCTGFIENIANSRKYDKIKLYFGDRILEYAKNWLNF